MARKKENPVAVRSRTQVAAGGAVYFVVTLLLLGAAEYSQANTLFWALGAMIGGLLVSIVVSWRTLSGLRVERVPPTHGVAGEPMVLRYVVTNRNSWLPSFGVTVGETFGRGTSGWKKSGPLAEKPARLKARPLGWVMHVGPRQRVQAEATCWPLRRGYLRFERIVLTTTFPFGILRRQREFERPAEVLVYPPLVRLDRRTLVRLSDVDPHGMMKLERGGGHEEFFGVREYRPGDSLKMIDWRRSARTGELVAREMTQPSPPKVLVALDLTHRPAEPPAQPAPKKGKAPPVDPPPDPVERAISLTASLICDAYFHGFQVGLVVLGAPCTAFPVHHSLPHRTRMLEALAQLDTSVTSDKPRSLPGKPNVVIRPEADGPDAAQGGQRVLSGAEMNQYVVSRGEGAGALLNRRPGASSRREEVRQESSWR